VQDARIAQADDTAHARERAVEQTAEKRGDEIDERYSSLRQAADDNGEPDADDAKKMLDMSQERAEYQSDAQEKLDKLGVRIDAAQQKLTVLGDSAPQSLQQGLHTAQQEHETLEQELASLRSVRSPGWDANKDQLEKRISDLQDRVGKLNDDIVDAAT
jgi:predicted  nucleic acid-binding Zn-ribbon protein